MLNFYRDACDHPLVRPGRDKGPHWDVLEIWTGYVEDVQSSLMPHAIISVASDVSADDADTSLTSCELSAIVNFIMCRKSCGPSRKHPVHPVSVHTTRSSSQLCRLIDSRSCFSLTLVETTEESFKPLMIGKA